jgi:hypothetical protein
MITKLTALACIAAATVLTAVAAAGSYATRFPGVPAAGVKVSTPITGRMAIDLRPTSTTSWTVYADGRVIWQKWTPSGDPTVVPAGASRLDTTFVQQRLTLRGVHLLRSKLLATGLFAHDLNLRTGSRNASISDQIRVGDRIVTVSGSPYPARPATKPTPAQTRALAWIAKLVADSARWLPTSVWADRQIRAFVPACYWMAFDETYPDPDLSKLPPPARKALSQYKQLTHHLYQVVRTRQARALLQALVKAGISPSLPNHALIIDFALPFADFHLSPALPNRCF